MHSTSPARSRSAKRQRMTLHLQVQGEVTPAHRMDFDVTPGVPLTVGLTWAIMEDREGVEQDSTPACEMASGSRGSTERVSPVTPEQHVSEGDSACRPVRGPGHISETELAAFMTGDEGLNVFRAWSSGGFSAEQILRLHGTHVMEAFVANQLVLETGTQSCG